MRSRRAARLWLRLVVLGFVAPAGAAPPGATGTLEAALAEILDGSRPCAALRVRYLDGDETLGTTRVTVWGGWAKVRRRAPDGVEEVFRGRVDRRMCLRLVRNALERRLWRVRARRRAGLPDETRPSIRVGVKGAGSFTVRLWGFDVQNKPGFAVARGQLLTLATRLSRGRVTY